MISDTIPLPVTVRDGLGNGNVLMSLPTSLIHCLLSDWVEVVSLIKLDFAFCGDGVFYVQLLDILKSDLFYIMKFEVPDKLPKSGISPPEHPYTHMLDWIVRRHLKVLHIEPHRLCSHVVLKTFLQRYGKYVRHICAYEGYNGSDEDNHSSTRSSLIAKYCQNLTAYVVYSFALHGGCILRVLNNNPRLEKLHITGSLDGGNPIATLHHLQQLTRAEDNGISHSLVALVRAAPNLQKLSILCIVDWIYKIDGALVVDVGRACPNLRTLSCNELHFGPNDSFLKPFLAVCSGIVNLDLSMHYDLTDTVLIDALSELHILKCLDLRDCCTLTDRTLQFLVKRFASTLQVLYLNCSSDIWEGDPMVPEEAKGNYTAAGIASLRAQCTHLHTFHYCVQVNDEAPAPRLDAYRSATIVHVFPECEASLPMILEHCQQMQIIILTSVRYVGSSVWLSADQLMAIAARCPQLHTVIIPQKDSKKDNEVDYSEVKKAFPKLLFTHDAAVVYFDVFEVPV